MVTTFCVALNIKINKNKKTTTTRACARGMKFDQLGVCCYF
jgi:hypothetical protein